MAVFMFVVAGVAWVFALASGFEGMSALGYVGIGLIIAGVINFSSYYWSDKLVLSLSVAKPIEKKNNDW